MNQSGNSKNHYQGALKDEHLRLHANEAPLVRAYLGQVDSSTNRMRDVATGIIRQANQLEVARQQAAALSLQASGEAIVNA